MSARILVVDDIEANVRLLEAKLTAEYYDVLKFRNLFFVPEKRNDCHIQLYVLPSGQITPCCAMMVQSHEADTSWLPNIADTSLQ